jgi:hypothetical protein
MAQEIYHIRLNTGEDLISEVSWPETKEGHEARILLHHPMKIICVPSNKPGFVTLSLMQWIFAKISSDQEFNIYSRDILTMSKPADSLREYYKETVDYFAIKNGPETIYEEDTTAEDFLSNLEKEISAIEKSDMAVKEDNEDMDQLRDVIGEFLKSLTSNNRGTLH